MVFTNFRTGKFYNNFLELFFKIDIEDEHYELQNENCPLNEKKRRFLCFVAKDFLRY